MVLIFFLYEVFGVLLSVHDFQNMFNLLKEVFKRN